MSDIERIRDFIADELNVRLDSFAVKTSDGRPDRASVDPEHESVVASAEAALQAAERLAACAQTAPMPGRKSLGEKLAIASANDAGLSATWDDCRADVKDEFERIALAFAASLSHDETASIVIASLRTRAEASEQREAGLREALTPSADTKAAYIGEIKFPVCVGTDDDGDEIWSDVTVPWDVTKAIMAMILARAALTKCGEAQP